MCNTVKRLGFGNAQHVAGRAILDGVHMAQNAVVAILTTVSIAAARFEITKLCPFAVASSANASATTALFGRDIEGSEDHPSAHGFTRLPSASG